MYFISLITILALAAIVFAAALFLFVSVYATIISFYKGAPYVRSKKARVETMLELADIKEGERIVDLGSGDGLILIEAAKRGAYATGIEINPFLVWYSKRHVKKSGVGERIKIIKSDFRKHDLGEADVVFLYLWPSTNEGLEHKFSRELRPGTRVISNGFPLPGLEPHASKNGVHVYYY